MFPGSSVFPQPPPISWDQLLPRPPSLRAKRGLPASQMPRAHLRCRAQAGAWSPPRSDLLVTAGNGGLGARYSHRSPLHSLSVFPFLTPFFLRPQSLSLLFHQMQTNTFIPAMIVPLRVLQAVHITAGRKSRSASRTRVLSLCVVDRRASARREHKLVQFG